MVHWKVKIELISQENRMAYEKVRCASVSADKPDLGSGHALVADTWKRNFY